MCRLALAVAMPVLLPAATAGAEAHEGPENAAHGAAADRPGLAVLMLPAVGLTPRDAGVAVRPLRGASHARQVVALRSAHLRVPTAVAMTETLS